MKAHEAEWTTIAVNKQTHDRLRKIRLVDRESYDSVLNRLIASYLTRKKTEPPTEATP